jgi:hypothetical protein
MSIRVKTSMLYKLALAFVWFALLSQGGSAWADNIVRNGEFENQKELEQTWIASGLKSTLDKDFSANGEYCLKLTSDNGGKGVISQVLNSKESLSGVSIALQMRYRLHGELGFRILLKANDKQQDLFVSEKGKQDCWIPVKTEACFTLPDGPVTLSVETTGKGTLWLDDLRLYPSYGANILRNGSFAGGLPPESLQWNLGNDSERKGFQAKIVNDCGRTDNNSLWIQADRDHDLNIFYPSIQCPVKPDTAYEFSVWMKGDGIKYKTVAQDTRNYSLMYFDMPEVGKPVNGWTPVKLSFRTPADCKTVQLGMLRHIGYNDSSAKLKFSIWVDDAELREAIADSDVVVPQHHDVAVSISGKDAKPLGNILFGLNTGNGYQGKSDYQLAGEKFLMRYDHPALNEAIKEIGIGCLRWGGTSANWWDWKNDWYFDMKIIKYHPKNIDSINLEAFLTRVSPKMWGVKKLWFDYFLDLCKTANIKPLVCINVNTDTPESATELVKNIESKGFPDLDYEMGNELHGEKYVREVVTFAKSVRQASPKSKIGTTEDVDDLAGLVESEGWHDAWIPHYYYREIPGDEHFLARHAFTDSEYMIAGICRRSKQLHPGREMWLTEWGWTPTKSQSREKTLLAALWNVDVLMHHLDYSDLIKYSVYHSLFDVYFGIINYDDNGQIIRSVPFYSHKMFYHAIKGANKLLGVEITGMPLMYASTTNRALDMVPEAQRGDDIPGLVVKAVSDPGNAQHVLLLNRTKDYQHVRLSYDGTVPKIEWMEQLAGKAYSDLFKVNGPTTNTQNKKFAVDRPVSERETVKPIRVENPDPNIVLPPYSFTVLKMHKK